MPAEISPRALDGLLSGNTQFALIDVREPGEYNSAHIPGASLMPRRELEARMADAAPHKATPIVVCDDDGRRAALAAATLERLGYADVSVLAGGVNRWVTQEYPTEWGVNVPSKDFGERVEVENAVPEIDAVELRRRIERGDELVILDTRTPEEYRRLCIPGGRSVPGAELALRITDIAKDLSADSTVVVNCAGRTRSIIGTRALQRMGVGNAVGLKNGTAGWSLAGYALEAGADRVEMPEPTAEAVAAAEEFADRVMEEDSARYLDIDGLRAVMARRADECVYLIDVRAEEEYAAGHIPGFRWFAGGQAVQRSDDVAVVKNCPIVFCCDGRARAAVTASWYRQMGHSEVYAVHGGTSEWQRAGNALAEGHPEAQALGLAEAQASVRTITAQELRAMQGAKVIFVDSSQQFASGHIPGSRWMPRGWLEAQIGDAVADKGDAVVASCADGTSAVFAAATLGELGYGNVAALTGGVVAWRAAGYEVEQGLAGVMSPPADTLPAGTDRSYADMMNYLRWEIALGEKYES